ncbi:hypothetical protein FE257_001239 [Aspergillus nanangensis]|uniref:Heterokaryon incompatibility domain-containing protein n=1 Tax=Aspergillus nanangensis TaxID=2582783 RepID=A0AAD4CFG2_ASPNN|nr:hypothetical protein FE257_001239 [Aspergillus nanangensis]
MVQDLFDSEDALSTTLVSGNKEEPKTSLCYRCRSLDLTVDKFIIGGKSTAVDIPQDPQRYEPKKAKETFRVKSGRNRRHFNTLPYLRDNRHICPLCDLIYRAIARYGKTNVDDNTSCSLTWELHGREPLRKGDGFINKTRRIRLNWNEKPGNQQEVYLMLVAPQDPLRPNSDASAKYQKNNHFLGRGFGDQKEKQALIKSWIDLCVEGHELCRDNHGTKEAFMDLIKETYFGVIDVADMQLKSLPMGANRTPEPYVALSYVWGRKAQHDPPYMTTRRTVMTHILHGGLETAWERLPRTIQDAMLIVSRLGYRYLWIDSLCIVQDSNSSWQLNASAMHLVYGNAQFTICAADGGDSSTGLRAVQPVLRTMRPAENAPEAMAPATEVGNPDDIYSEPMSAECAPGVRLMVTRPLEAVVSDSVWSKRAWTFEERILSRRCLIFAEGRVYWQCRAISISQDIHTDGSSKGLSLDLTNSPLRTLQELQRRPLWSYMSYVSMYTGRLLTKQRDALAAFQGISWLLGRYMDTPFLFGLPASHFDLALLWGPLEALKQRKPGCGSQTGQQTCTVDELGNCTCQAEQESFGDLEFPTWAWAGWMGAKIEYQSGMLDGCLENVREWLINHTWIQWHIRDEKGHLQPLWDILIQETTVPYFSGPPGNQEDRLWGGYPVLRIPTRQPRQPPPAIVAGPGNRPPHDAGLKPAGPPRPHFLVAPNGVESSAVVDSAMRPRRPRSPTSDIYIPMPYKARANIREQEEPDPSRRSRDHKYSSSISDEYEISETEVLPADSRSDQSHEYERVTNKRYVQRQTQHDIEETDSTLSASIVERVDNSAYVGKSHSGFTPSPFDEANFHTQPPKTDQYGRLIPGNIPRSENKFRAILPDNPFGVLRRKPGRKRKSPASLRFMPIIQFWTWRSELHVVIRDANTKGTIKQSGTGLCQCDIVDAEGDWCGSIVLDDRWIRARQAHIFTFIAISEAKRFTMDECPVWTYYIPKEREESEWDLYYVLLLERNDERGLWERAGLGKVFQAAFRDNVWAEIKLG